MAGFDITSIEPSSFATTVNKHSPKHCNTQNRDTKMESDH